jgi:hypothetical protein
MHRSGTQQRAQTRFSRLNILPACRLRHASKLHVARSTKRAKVVCVGEALFGALLVC